MTLRRLGYRGLRRNHRLRGRNRRLRPVPLITRLPLIIAGPRGIAIGRLIVIGVRRLIRRPAVIIRRRLSLLGIPACILILAIHGLLGRLVIRRLPAEIRRWRRRGLIPPLPGKFRF